MRTGFECPFLEVVSARIAALKPGQKVRWTLPGGRCELAFQRVKYCYLLMLDGHEIETLSVDETAAAKVYAFLVAVAGR